MNEKNYDVFIKIYIVFVIAVTIAAFLLAKDKPMATLSVFPIILAAIAIWVSMDSTKKTLDLAKDSLKLTNTTLEKTETEQEIRDIEKRLSLFYYPLLDYLEEEWLLTNNLVLENYETKTVRANERYNEIRRYIAPYRYLATGDIRIKFEAFRINGYQFHNPYEKKTFVDSVREDIRAKETTLRKKEQNIVV